jgi:hypothetical protein
VKGTGTYFVIDATTACGGKLQGSGEVTLAASRSGANVAGKVSFGSEWNPSLVATLDDSMHLSGTLQAPGIGCPFALTYGLVP